MSAASAGNAENAESSFIGDSARLRAAAHALAQAHGAARDVAKESRDAYRRRVRDQAPIAARLIAAVVPKPIPVTGWSLGSDPDSQNSNSESPIRAPGAKPTHLAVPAGAVYYFACDTAEAARQLAAALNWHGDTPGTTIRNRRSTLLGEKGFGLGVCGTWQPHGQR